MKLLITGASGFIGSHFIRHGLSQKPREHQIRALIRNTDQRNLRRLNFPEVHKGERDGYYQPIYGDLLGDISGICEGIDWVVHFAAKTFVDRAIKDPEPFVMSNTVGSLRMLTEARKDQVKKFVMISTDEVLGSILVGAHNETAPHNPTNHYSASKGAAEDLAISFAHSHGLNTVITRCENCYGRWQHPQKVFPVFTKRAMRDLPLPVYGDGLHVRQWLHVSDHVSAILHLLQADTSPGSIYHVAGQQELTNLELAHRILKALGKPLSLIEHIDDRNIRPGHDRRYALDCAKINNLGWRAQMPLEDGIDDAVNWYAGNPAWTEN